jgi:hypothetical protein
MKHTRNIISSSRRRRRNKTMKGGFSPRIQNFLSRILNRAIEYRFPNHNNSSYYKLLVHSVCHKNIIKRIIKEIIKNFNNEIWQLRYAGQRDMQSKKYYMLLNILIVAGLTTPAPAQNNASMVDYIMQTEAASIDAVLNNVNNLYKIKVLVHSQPNMFDAETLDELVSHFPDEISEPVAAWEPNVAPLDVSPASDEE